MKIMTEINETLDIPALFFYPENAHKLPLVMVFHGFDNDKYEGAKLGLKLAEAGCSVLCIDIHRHGDRYDDFMDEIHSDVAFGRELFRIVEHTTQDYKSIIHEIQDHKAVDISRVGIIGLSHGANICHYLLSQVSGIKSCAALLGSPDFVSLLAYSMEKVNLEDFESTAERDLLTYVQGLNPFQSLKNTQTPLLMINGSKDDNVPYHYSQALYEEKAPESIMTFLLEDEYHFLSNTMIERALQWTIQYLFKTNS